MTATRTDWGLRLATTLISGAGTEYLFALSASLIPKGGGVGKDKDISQISQGDFLGGKGGGFFGYEGRIRITFWNINPCL